MDNILIREEIQLDKKYLVCESDQKDCIDRIGLGMISNNEIKGLIPVTYMQSDDKYVFKYDISNKKSVKEVLDSKVNKFQVEKIIRDTLEVAVNLKEYMLDDKKLLMEIDNVYLSNNNTIFIYCPIKTINNSLKDFIRELIDYVSGCGENTRYITLLSNYLNKNDECSLYDLVNIEEESNVNNDAVFANSDNIAPKYVAQPQVPSYMSQPQAPNCVAQPQVPNYAAQQQVPNYAAQPQTPNYGVQPQASNYMAQPQVPNYMSQPQASNYGAQPQVNERQEQVNNNTSQSESTEKSKRIYEELNNKSNTQKNRKGKGPKDMEIPGRKTPIPNNKPEIPKKVSNSNNINITNYDEDDEISLFYLLQHYNKENAEKYKMQKERKKTGKKSSNNVAQSNSVQDLNVQKQESKPSYLPNEINSRPANFGETTVLTAGENVFGETTVLTAEQLNILPTPAFLIRIKNNEKIVINKPRFRIGKEKSYVDYFISDNPAISRSHVDIINNNGVYEIVDLVSTNHTFVNGVMISSNEPIALKSGDQIRLGNEAFEFRL